MFWLFVIMGSFILSLWNMTRFFEDHQTAFSYLGIFLELSSTTTEKLTFLAPFFIVVYLQFFVVFYGFALSEKLANFETTLKQNITLPRVSQINKKTTITPISM